MRRIRVAHVITRLCQGGAQENTFHTVRLANRDRFEVDLISGPTDGNEGSIEPAVAAAGIEIIRVPHLVRNVNLLWDWRAYRELLRLFRARRYDIVHTHTSKAGYLGRLAAAHAGVPIVVHTPHGHVFFGYFNALLTRAFTLLERHAARKTDRLIALTPRGIEEHLAQGVGTRAQWTAVFSGIDLAPFETAIARREQTRVALGIGADALLIGAVGRLEPIKGFTYFVAAARTVARSLSNACFVIAGDGEQRATLEAQAKHLGERIRFLGRRDDVPGLMAAMDLCIVPSLNEGMGRVVLEAAAAGTPVVASRVGGVPDVVRDGETGLLVPPGDSDAIAAACIMLLNNVERRRRMAVAARTHAASYSLGHMVAQIEGLYETLIQEKCLDH